MNRPRALLTGRNGFTGNYIARVLKGEGYEVIGLSDRHEPDGEDSIVANILDHEAIQKAVASVQPDVVFHFAAISHVAHGNAGEIYRVNVEGTRNLLEALGGHKHRPEIVVIASSANIYGNAKVEPIAEDTQLAPTNDYAVSKLAMEYMTRLWMDRLPIVITRPFNYTGVGQSEQFLIPKIVSHFRRGESVIELGNTEVVRDFSDVRDVTRAYLAILHSRPIGKIFNICSGVGHSLNEILEMMAEISGYRIEKRINSAFVRTNDISRLVGSSNKLENESGWKPQYKLYETLEWMYGRHDNVS